jgi:hypothetical protein
MERRRQAQRDSDTDEEFLTRRLPGYIPTRRENQDPQSPQSFHSSPPNSLFTRVQRGAPPGDGMMIIQPGPCLRKRSFNTNSGPSSSGRSGELGNPQRKLFCIRDVENGNAELWRRLYEANLLDYIQRGPVDLRPEVESRLTKDTLQDMQIQRRYRMMFGSTAPDLTRLQIRAVQSKPLCN